MELITAKCIFTMQFGLTLSAMSFRNAFARKASQCCGVARYNMSASTQNQRTGESTTSFVLEQPHDVLSLRRNQILDILRLFRSFDKNIEPIPRRMEADVICVVLDRFEEIDDEIKGRQLEHPFPHVAVGLVTMVHREEDLLTQKRANGSTH